MKVTPQLVKDVYDKADCLYSHEQVDAAITLLADQLTQTFYDTNPIILCVMTGGLVVASELLLKLHFPLQLDYIHATRYGDETAGNELKWLVSPRQPLGGRNVLIVDDILDEGYTLQAIIEYCRSCGVADVKSAVLVDKQHDRRGGLAAADFYALKVPDRYVFGYGMDYKGYLRNVPGIYAAQKEHE